MPKPLRLGVVGGRRGGSFNLALETLKNRLKLTAICDLNPEMLAKWESQHSGIATFTDYDEMLKSDTCDAVLVASPMQLHAKQATAALKAGKHVLSEVIACTTDREAKALVKAVEQSGCTYMLAENYCYMRPHMMVKNMVEKGVFGELNYAEGMYIHDCRKLLFYDDASLTWRGELKRDLAPGHKYPTHSFGPIAQWMGINRDDAIDTVYSATSRAWSGAAYAEGRFGKSHEQASESAWALGDSTNVLIKTKLGRVVSLRIDSVSPRPHNMTVHELQGTNACYRTQASPKDEPLVWVDGKSPGSETPARKRKGHVSSPTGWDKLYDYAKKWEHPRWKKWGATAKKAGHGGGDFFILQDFVSAVEGKAENPIDVYDAVTWSSIMWLSQKSEKTGRAVKATDYRSKKSD